MKKRLLYDLTIYKACLVLLLAPPCAAALSTDKDQDIEVEADTAMLDDTRNISIYTGNVVVTQGSMRITGDKLTLYYTDDRELEKTIVEGTPATFRQLPDNSAVYDEAEAKVMEYYESDSLLILTGSAFILKDRNRLTGARVEYDTERSQVLALGSLPETPAATTDSPATGEDTRVRVIIPPREKDEAAEN